MAGPSVQNLQEQGKQAPQNAWAQTAPIQQPLHPMVTGGYGPPPLPPLAPQSANVQSGGMAKGITINMGKISLLAISLSLMLFGSFIFLGGFLLGMWFGGPEKVSFASRGGETLTLGLLPPQQQIPAAQTMPAPQGGWIPADLSQQAGSAATNLVTNATIPGVPQFLAPLATDIQSSVGQQTGTQVQQQVGGTLGQPVSPPPQPQPTIPTGSTMAPQPALTPQTSPMGHGSLPVITQPPVAPAAVSSKFLSQGQGGADEYTIQLGVYAAQENANALVNHMQALNYTSHIIEGKAPDGNPLYYVHSGLYNDYTTALDAASQFASQNIPGATVVKVSSKNTNAS